jgi:hypothetical protein
MTGDAQVTTQRDRLAGNAQAKFDIKLASLHALDAIRCKPIACPR